MTNAMNAIANLFIRISLMDYYVLLQSHIEEADKAGLLCMLLIPANMEEVCLLPNWEARVWRERQGWVHAIARATSFADFVDERLGYTTNMFATRERLMLPKPIPLHSHRSQRSPSLESRGGRYDQGSSGGRKAWAMALREDRGPEEKRVHFPPPKAWVLESKWTQDCVMKGECQEKHLPVKCEIFKGLTTHQRLAKVEE